MLQLSMCNNHNSEAAKCIYKSEGAGDIVDARCVYVVTC